MNMRKKLSIRTAGGWLSDYDLAFDDQPTTIGINIDLIEEINLNSSNNGYSNEFSTENISMASNTMSMTTSNLDYSCSSGCVSYVNSPLLTFHDANEDRKLNYYGEREVEKMIILEKEIIPKHQNQSYISFLQTFHNYFKDPNLEAKYLQSQCPSSYYD